MFLSMADKSRIIWNRHLRKTGVETPASALGSVGMAYFMGQFDKGRGNYTADREQLLSGITLDEIVRDVYDMEKTKRK